MTMKRTEKTKHEVQLRNAERHTYTAVRFASPKLIIAARADRGHDYMTGAEYAEHRMGRRQVSVHQEWDSLMTRRGFRGTESGRWVKVTRK